MDDTPPVSPPTAAQAFDGRDALLTGAALVSVYALSVAVGQSMAFVGNTVSPVWPTAGVGLAAAWLFGWVALPLLFVTDVAVTVNSGLSLPWPVALALAALTTGVTGLSGLVLARCLRQRPLSWTPLHQRRLARGVFPKDGRSLLVFLAVAAVAAGLEATVGAGVLTRWGGVAPPLWPELALAWAVGDLLGLTLFAPWLVMLAHRGPWRGWGLEHLAVLLLGLVAAAVVFGPWVSLPGHWVPWVVALFPLGLWASLRLGLAGASTLSVLMGSVAVGATAQGWGVLAQVPPLERLVALQALLGMFAVSGLAVAASVRGRDRALTALHDAVQVTDALMFDTTDGKLLLEAGHTVVRSNAAAQQLLNLATDAETPVRFADQLPSEQRGLAAHLERLLPGETSSFQVVLAPDGPVPRTVDVRARGYHGTQGRGVLLVLRDVTDQHAALDALERDREVFWSGPVVALVWGLEADLPVVYASPNVFSLLGYRCEELTDPDFRMHSLIHPDDHVRVQREVAAFTLARAASYEQRYRLRHRGGHWVHVLDATRVRYHASGRVLDKRGYLLDQTAEAQARADAARLLQALDQSPDSVVITDLAGNTEYVNRAYTAMTGYTLDEVRGQNQRLLASGKTPRQRHAELWKALTNGQTWEGEFINRKKSGEEFAEWLKVAPVRDSEGRATQYLAVKQDMSAHRATEARVLQLSRFDPLTGLANRAHLLDALKAACADAQPGLRTCALVVVNISRFKRINDAQGHEAGDEVLQAVAHALAAPLSTQELAARLGADEFGLLLRAAEGDVTRRVLSLLSAVRQRLAIGVSANGQMLNVDLITAATLFPESAADAPAAVMLRAENALNAARETGHAEVRFFDAVMGDVARQRFVLEQELQQGIPRGELRLFLQAQVLADGRLAGCEALVRWQHPTRGLLAPGVFIGLAEESDLIVTLEQWVFAQVFELVARQEAAGTPLHCSVNLSARHFRQPGFVPWIRGLLERTGAPAERLTLEITESIALDAIEDVVSRMLVLRRMGLHFSLDDFGTGFSSLSYLRRLPISELKIDKSFVNDVPAEPDAVALVRTILNVARSLQLRVVAEGVETQAQAGFLSQASGADARLQGYLFSRPVPVEEWLGMWREAPPVGANRPLTALSA